MPKLPPKNSNANSKSTEPPARRPPRALSLTLPDARRPCLLLDNREYILRNFSENGIGLWLPATAPFSFNSGRKIKADIVVENQIHPVELVFVHHSDRVAGLRIVHKSEDLRKIFRTLLEPSQYASELEAHAMSGSMDRGENYSRLWYHARGGTQLMVWYQEGQRRIMSLQLSWLGKFVRRDQFKPPVTGFLENSGNGGHRITQNELLIVHSQPDAQIMHQAAQFLNAVPFPLPGGLLWQFLETGEQVFLPERCLSGASGISKRA